jgi:uroporphyrinogen-III synthase
VVERIVILTRARGENAAIATGLAALGIASRDLPCVIVRPLDDPAPLRVAMRALSRDDLLVITSRAGARAVGRALAGAICRAPVAAVGRATAEACTDEGLRVIFVPSIPSAAALAAELPLPRGATVLARSGRAAREPIEILAQRGAHVREVVAYHTAPVAPRGPIRDGAVALFASPSAVEGFALSGATLSGAVAIGASTAARVRAVLGIEPRVAGTDEGAMVDALEAMVKEADAIAGR